MLFQGIKQQRAVSETLLTTVKYFHFNIVLSGNTPLPVWYFASFLGKYASYLSFEKKYEMKFPNVVKQKIFFSNFTKCEIYFPNLQNSGYITKSRIWRDHNVKYCSIIRLHIRAENLVSRVSKRFHSLEQYQVLNLQYQVSAIFIWNGSCDLFLSFWAKRRFLRSKIHNFGSLEVSLLNLNKEKFVKKIP